MVNFIGLKIYLIEQIIRNHEFYWTHDFFNESNKTIELHICATFLSSVMIWTIHGWYRIKELGCVNCI